MSVTASFASHLKNDADVSAEVSDNVYVNIAEPNPGAKFITVQRLPGTEHVRNQGGASGKVQYSFQVNCYADAAEDAETIGDAVRDALDGLTRATLGTSPNNMTAISVTLEDDNGDYVSVSDGSEQGKHVVRMTWSVWAAETVPAL